MTTPPWHDGSLQRMTGEWSAPQASICQGSHLGESVPASARRVILVDVLASAIRQPFSSLPDTDMVSQQLMHCRNLVSYSDGPKGASTGRLLYYLTPLDATAVDLQVS